MLFALSRPKHVEPELFRVGADLSPRSLRANVRSVPWHLMHKRDERMRNEGAFLTERCGSVTDAVNATERTEARPRKPIEVLNSNRRWQPCGHSHHNRRFCRREGRPALRSRWAGGASIVRNAGQYADCPLPDMIFLDVTLPGVSGLDVLEAIRSTPELMHIPIVVVSGSQNPEDVRAVYALNGNCFIRRPIELAQLVRFIETCYEFWNSVVTLSSNSRHDAANAVASCEGTRT